MWFLPTRGRPEALLDLVNAPGGWPQNVMVLVDEFDPMREDYERLPFIAIRSRGWKISIVPGNGRVCDAWRYVFEQFPNESFYGILSDDYWPETERWWEQLERAAGTNRIAYAWGQNDWPKIRSAVAFGGDLIRAMGGLVPAEFRHNYLDDVWERIGKDFDLLSPCENVRVLHRHWRFGFGKKDETYERGSVDIADDRITYTNWLISRDRVEMNKRIAKMISPNGEWVEFDFSKVNLGILFNTRESSDAIFNRCLHNTLSLLRSYGINHGVTEGLGSSHVGKAREFVLWAAMANTKSPFTHLMWIDDDMGWDSKDVIKLITYDRDIVAAVGIRKSEEKKFCFNSLDGAVVEDGLLEVKDVGFAFVLMKRKVIDILCASYPELQYKTGDGSRQFALFYDLLDRSNPNELPERLGEDLSFCRRWRKIGGQVFVDPSIELIHSGRYEYRGRLSDHMKSKIVTMDYAAD